MKIVSFHVIMVPNGMVYIGLGDDNLLYIYNIESESWKTLKENNEEGAASRASEEVRRKLLGGLPPEFKR